MAEISRALLNEFAKQINTPKENNAEVITYGTVIETSDDGAVVRVDGSNVDTRTPVYTVSTVKIGDRVAINISRHQAIIVGNASDNSIGSTEVNEKIIDSSSIVKNDVINTVTETVENNYATKVSVEGIENKIDTKYGEVINQINTTFVFNEDGLDILKSDSGIYSHQDNDSYEFRNASLDDETVLKIEPDGMTATNEKLTGSLDFGDGTVENFEKQWSIKRGNYIEGVGYNLDFIWMGG